MEVPSSKILEQNETEEYDSSLSKSLTSKDVTLSKMETKMVPVPEEQKQDEENERAFFEMVVKAVIHNQPTHLIQEFTKSNKQIDPEQMYERVLAEKVEYHQFIEWVEHDIGMQVYKDFDALFREAHKRYLKDTIKDNDVSNSSEYVITEHNKNLLQLVIAPKKQQPVSARNSSRPLFSFFNRSDTRCVT